MKEKLDGKIVIVPWVTGNVMLNVSNYEILPYEEQLKLFYKWKNTGDEEALHKLAESHMRLAFSIADQFGNRNLQEDLRNEAALAVITAIHKWDPKRSALSTFVAMIVRQKLSRLLKSYESVIAIPYNVQIQLQKYPNSMAIYRADISKNLKKRLQRALTAKSISTLNTQVDRTECVDSNLLSEDPKIEVTEMIEKLLDNLKYLNKKDQKLICRYFGLNSEPRQTFIQISKWYGRSPQLISRHLQQLLAELPLIGICKNCGKSFNPDNYNFWCSPECHYRYMVLQKVQFKQCRNCGRLFIPNSKFRSYCCIPCRIHADKTRSHQRKSERVSTAS